VQAPVAECIDTSKPLCQQSDSNPSLPAVLLCCCTLHPVALSAYQLPTSIVLSQHLPALVLVLQVTVGTKAPDCVERKVILINGQFQPRLTFTQGDWVEVRKLYTTAAVYVPYCISWTAEPNGSTSTHQQQHRTLLYELVASTCRQYRQLG
jgi:hypothetical protein